MWPDGLFDERSILRLSLLAYPIAHLESTRQRVAAIELPQCVGRWRVIPMPSAERQDYNGCESPLGAYLRDQGADAGQLVSATPALFPALDPARWHSTN